MWIYDYLISGMQLTVPDISLGIFRTLFGGSCMLKFLVEARRGHYTFFQPGTFLYFRYYAGRPRIPLSGGVYRSLYIIKTMASAAILAGVYPRPALLLLSLALATDLRIYFKFHANLMFLFAIILALSPSCGESLQVWRALLPGESFAGQLTVSREILTDPFAAVLIALTMCVVYCSTAYRKMNRVFLSGTVLAAQLNYVQGEKSRRKSGDFHLPPAFLNLFASSDTDASARRWRPWMLLTVALELLLPALLLCESTRAWGVTLGALMHALFAVLYPETLMHFSLLSVSSYILFVDPRILATRIAG